MMKTDAAQQTADRLERRVHPGCIVCGAVNARGLHLDFAVGADGGVTARFACTESLEGYPGILHGGVISTLLDGAMGHCLFARGMAAVTVEMTTRFRHPVVTGQDAAVSARLVRTAHPLYLLDAEITQGGTVKATATGKFFHQPDRPVPTGLQTDALFR